MLSTKNVDKRKLQMVNKMIAAPRSRFFDATLFAKLISYWLEYDLLHLPDQVRSYLDGFVSSL